MVRRFSGVRRVAVVAMIAVAGLAAVAPAQDGGGGRGGGGFGGQMMGAGVNSRDLERYQDMLNLTKDQRETVKALFEGYQEQSRTSGQEMRDKMQEMRDQMRDGGDADARRGMGQMMTEFRQKRQKMDDSFFSDVQAVLNEQQKTIWPKVERTRRREQNINRGLMSGERADVIKIVEDEKLPAEVKAKLEPVLDQYAVELDKELTSRTKIFDENMAKVMDLMGQGDPTQMAEKIEPMLKQSRDAAVKVRDVNRKYARQVQELLPDDKKVAFDHAFKLASFRGVYQQSQSGRQIAAAQGFADLTEEQKTAIAALKESHARDEAAAQDKLAAAMEENEMKMTADQLMRRLGGGMMGGRGQGGPGGGGQGGGQGAQNGGRGGNNNQAGGQGGRGNQGGGNAAGGGRGGPPQEEGAVGELRTKSRELDKNASESLKKILRPEQVDRLPQQDDRGPGGGGGGDNQPQRRRGGQNNRT